MVSRRSSLVLMACFPKRLHRAKSSSLDGVIIQSVNGLRGLSIKTFRELHSAHLIRNTGIFLMTMGAAPRLSGMSSTTVSSRNTCAIVCHAQGGLHEHHPGENKASANFDLCKFRLHADHFTSGVRHWLPKPNYQSYLAI